MGAEGAVSNKKDVVAPGLFEGLRLLLRHPYVLGIFAVSALFEVIATIMDYQMKVLGKARHHSTADSNDCVTLRPFSCATPSWNCAFACPCSAALRHHSTALSWD